MDKTKVTILDMQPIDPPVGGGRLRLLGLYSGFQNNIEATYVGSYDWRGPEFRCHKLSDCLTEIDVPLSEEHFKAHDELSSRIGKGCIDTAFPLQGHLSTDFIERAQEEAKKSEVVVFSHQWIFPFVASVLDADRQLIVYDAQNCEGLLRVKLLEDGTELTDEVCRGAVRCEYELCHAADLILACSQEDKDSFIHIYGVDPDKIIIVPNGVFTSRVLPCEESRKKKLRAKLGLTKPTVCFIGSGYYPNEEAGRLIVEVADALPQYQFIIIGGVGNNLRDISREEHPNVMITGFVEEEEKLEYLAVSDIAVNPMLSGSGTNIKMFDFMAAGLPIITTDIGARGIANTNGRVYQLCEKTADNLGQNICDLMQDAGQQECLRKYARLEAEERYSWEKVSWSLGGTLTHAYIQKTSARERILMVSTYPPEKCGIGAYAQQQVKYLRQLGAKVDVMAIKGNGKYRMELNTPEKILELKNFKKKYDRIIIQYHASFYYKTDGDVSDSIKTHKAFTNVFQDNPNIEVVCHEIKYPVDRNNTGLSRKKDIAENKVKREKWLATSSVVFHSQIEKDTFCQKLDIQTDEKKIKIVPPNFYYVKNRDISKSQARAELGIPLEKQIFLCIGFIQPHKAFDKVAEAFTKLHKNMDKQLYMVGSLRLVYSETKEYLQLLEQYTDKNETIFLKSQFVSDEIFDTWLIACDVVVVPYEEIWTSGVLGRAKLFQKRCIVRDVGGLKEQLCEGDIIFNEYKELVGIIDSWI